MKQRIDDFSEVLVEFTPALRRMARGLARDVTLADDLVQETLLRAWTHRRRFTPGTNQKAWLSTILRNCFYSAMRHHARWKQTDITGVTEPSAAGAQEPALVLKDIVQRISRLPKPQREALVMVGIEQLSYAETAGLARVSVGTAKSRVSRARASLRTHYPPGSGF